MSRINKLVDVIYMAKDFIGVISGNDYFHQPDLLGNYFIDGKSYYIDFSGKVNWKGDMIEEVPVLFIPSLNRYVAHPGMVLQYGLGSIDMYFLSGKKEFKDNIQKVTNWLLKHCNEDGSYDNYVKELKNDSTIKYYSNNSAMTQGEVLSFVTRIIKFNLVEQDDEILYKLLDIVYKNLISPISKGGGTLYNNDKVILCEYCREDDYIVLNGWVFAIFGILDYSIMTGDEKIKMFLIKTTTTLSEYLNTFIVTNDNWSYYDNKKRLCSPMYQLTHINQLDALTKLFTQEEEFKIALKKIKSGFNNYNKIKYTLNKIIDKLTDTQLYTR